MAVGDGDLFACVDPVEYMGKGVTVLADRHGHHRLGYKKGAITKVVLSDG
jgi:hypothetical protein